MQSPLQELHQYNKLILFLAKDMAISLVLPMTLATVVGYFWHTRVRKGSYSTLSPQLARKRLQLTQYMKAGVVLFCSCWLLANCAVAVEIWAQSSSSRIARFSRSHGKSRLLVAVIKKYVTSLSMFLLVNSFLLFCFYGQYELYHQLGARATLQAQS
jgi:ABC-type Fe3+ transport system permease subunit